MSKDAAWSQLCRGEARGLRALYETYASALLRFGYTHTRDRQLAEDVLQELFTHLWQKREELSNVDHVKSYLFTAMRNRLYRKLTYNPQWSDIDNTSEDTFQVEVTVQDPSSAASALDQDERALLRDIVDRLSPRQKEIVYLKYFEGMDYDEISDIMNLEYQSLRNLMNKAMKNLRKMNLLILLFFGTLGYISFYHVSWL